MRAIAAIAPRRSDPPPNPMLGGRWDTTPSRSHLPSPWSAPPGSELRGSARREIATLA